MTDRKNEEIFTGGIDKKMRAMHEEMAAIFVHNNLDFNEGLVTTLNFLGVILNQKLSVSDNAIQLEFCMDEYVIIATTHKEVSKRTVEIMNKLEENYDKENQGKNETKH